MDWLDGLAEWTDGRMDWLTATRWEDSQRNHHNKTRTESRFLILGFDLKLPHFSSGRVESIFQ